MPSFSGGGLRRPAGRGSPPDAPSGHEHVQVPFCRRCRFRTWGRWRGGVAGFHAQGGAGEPGGGFAALRLYLPLAGWPVRRCCPDRRRRCRPWRGWGPAWSRAHRLFCSETVPPFGKTATHLVGAYCWRVAVPSGGIARGAGVLRNQGVSAADVRAGVQRQAVTHR